MSKKIKRAFLLVLALVMAACVFGCSGSSKPAKQETAVKDDTHAFVFTGTTESNTGRTLNISILGEKDSDALAVEIKELPLLELGGRYEFVENKGYKIYLNDGNDTFAYAQYDPATKDFSMPCYIDMGSYGMQKVNFTYHDEDFAASYDGVGLGKTPPAFLMTHGWGGGVQEGSGKLACNEDGTVSASATCAAGIFVTRTGTWTYDEANDRYEIVFSEPYDLSDMEPNGVFNINIWYGSRNEVGQAEVKTVEEVLDPSGINSWCGPFYAEYNAEAGQYETQAYLIWTWGAAKEEIAVFNCAY